MYFRRPAKITKTIFVLAFAAQMAVFFPAHAALRGPDTFDQLKAAGESMGENPVPTDPRFIVADIIKVALGLLGTIFVALAVYAGFLWMTAAGESEKVDKAKKLLMDAVIGLGIILAAYSITLLAFKLALGVPDESNVWRIF